MGLHQMILGRTVALPCDCDADDDHGSLDVQGVFDSNEATLVQDDSPDNPDAPHPYFDMNWQNAQPSDDVWTDGSE
jgi:hypothetical protein